MNATLQSDFIGEARTIAQFYQGFTDIMAGDQDENFKFLAELFVNADRSGLLKIGSLEFAAIAQFAGLFGMYNDYHAIAGRASALMSLVDDIGDSGLSSKGIDELRATWRDHSSELREVKS